MEHEKTLDLLNGNDSKHFEVSHQEKRKNMII